MRNRSRLLFAKKCPNVACLSSTSISKTDPNSVQLIRRGSYWRASDSRWIARFECVVCRKSFSSSRLTACFNQKKRRINAPLAKLLASSVSMRRAAILLQVNRKTIARRLRFLGAQSEVANRKFMDRSFLHGEGSLPIQEVQFDELETFEYSKCLPLSVPLIIHPKTRKILGYGVASMPSKGPLARQSFEKYGRRKDERAQVVSRVFKSLVPYMDPCVEILSDKNPRYPTWIKRHFPKARHLTVPGMRGRYGGFGELKKIGHDPIFDLNHTCAMLRANLNRLVRRTWCTTKRADCLLAHLAIYVRFHNETLTKALLRPAVKNSKRHTGGPV